jgi:DNA-binding CsgD family transcriptional regulator/tetratricopeptide (TPR) repeat protein
MTRMNSSSVLATCLPPDLLAGSAESPLTRVMTCAYQGPVTPRVWTPDEQPQAGAVKTAGALQRGRRAYARRRWRDAFESLSLSDREAPLEAEDLELLATSAYMLGRRDDVTGLERAYHLHLDAGEPLRAARCAGWAGMHLATRGELGRATAWLARAQRLVEGHGRDCVEQGYLLFPLMFQQEASGDYEAAAVTAARAAEIGERFRDVDLFALAAQSHGILLVRLGQVTQGLRLMDEAMVAVTGGELSPIVNGLVYCGVIFGCQLAYELRRAREWTLALTQWCEEQPDLVSFSGTCLVHRAEIMQLQGSWREALEEAQRARERCAQAMNQRTAAQACHQQGELHRLQGEFLAAEQSYRDASQGGWEPQPGLALLRLAQGDERAAAAAIRRALREAVEPPTRAGLLPAYIEIMLAVGDSEEASAACHELEEISTGFESELLRGTAAYARGAVELAAGEAPAALVALRRASQVWQELDAPYEAARTRVLIGLACRALGDEDTAALELEAARSVFGGLGARPDVSRVDSLARRAGDEEVHGLTPRELQVLRLVAAGKTNRTIAAELGVSRRTIDRHVSNMFTKLRLSSRAAATAYAYEHRLV